MHQFVWKQCLVTGKKNKPSNTFFAKINIPWCIYKIHLKSQKNDYTNSGAYG